jgi:hypothetical protein
MAAMAAGRRALSALALLALLVAAAAVRVEVGAAVRSRARAAVATEAVVAQVAGGEGAGAGAGEGAGEGEGEGEGSGDERAKPFSFETQSGEGEGEGEGGGDDDDEEDDAAKDTELQSELADDERVWQRIIKEDRKQFAVPPSHVDLLLRSMVNPVDVNGVGKGEGEGAGAGDAGAAGSEGARAAAGQPASSSGEASSDEDNMDTIVQANANSITKVSDGKEDGKVERMEALLKKRAATYKGRMSELSTKAEAEESQKSAVSAQRVAAAREERAKFDESMFRRAAEFRARAGEQTRKAEAYDHKLPSEDTQKKDQELRLLREAADEQNNKVMAQRAKWARAIEGEETEDEKKRDKEAEEAKKQLAAALAKK